MDILNFHKRLVGNYSNYIQSFLSIKDQRIADFVKSEIANKKLWPEPLVQFNPTFEVGRSISSLVADGKLQPELARIFRSYDRNLFKHQEEAILLGAGGMEFVVTSGTGSGKSLTYIATIFNHVLQQGAQATGKIQAVVVYPMNALINSQFKEIKKFKDAYEELYGKPFPITFGQYTGQESEEQKEQLKSNPPHILLTNYMMLELLMTRSGRDQHIRQNFLNHINYLVFDELHTYRGRQGSDVSMLIRRIKAAATNPVVCIGTSATMVSGDAPTLQDQKQKVAEVASTIFGSDIKADQVVNEYLVKSLGGGTSATKEDLLSAIQAGISKDASAVTFERHPTANWIEENVALEKKDGILVRRKPTQLSNIAKQLADYTGADHQIALDHLEKLLEWANLLNTDPEKKKNFLPYRIHQFIAQTGSVYSTLGDQASKELYLDAGLYAGDKDTLLYPMVFSRNSGHEFTCVRLNSTNGTILPREFNDIVEEEEGTIVEEGYLFVQHETDDEPIWDPIRDIEELPETWFGPPRRDGSRKMNAEREARLPRKIWFNSSGDFSETQELEYEGWFISSPLMIDPTSGTVYDSQTAEWTKVMKLGGEGRSTATTVLSFETITQLHQFGEPYEKQKLLSFTDNRQDASLQAGHFNDFVKVGQLRAAIAKALNQHGALDYTNITDAVFATLGIDQSQYAKSVATFPGPKKENEDALKSLIMYRLLHDLRRSWRMVLPNLEQCALLKIDYKHLAESVQDHTLWMSNDLLKQMNPDQRHSFLHQIFDHFRKAYALSFSMLDPGSITTNARTIKEKLKAPWTLDETEKLEFPSFIRLEKLSNTARNLYTESAGPQSLFGRFIKSIAAKYDIDIRSKKNYLDFTHGLLSFLTDAGWLAKKPVRTSENEESFVYQIKVDYIVWRKGDGQTLQQDLIRQRSYRPLIRKPNTYFQQFYTTDFLTIKPIEGREHTGQISSDKRKSREEEFRNGAIGALFCSPTMELGIDISDLSIVHMRNVPPSPANYAQRSGRAGRSGQAALVLVYCSNFSAHDRHYFKHATQMVAGSVSAPRMDLVNEELLLSHLNASILSHKSLSMLNRSLGDLVDTGDFETLPLKNEVIEAIKIGQHEKERIISDFKKVVADVYFKRELANRKPSWFTDTWIYRHIDAFQNVFDSSLNRWRILYKAAQGQIKAATSIIENKVYGDDHEKLREANRSLRQAVRQRELLLNDTTGNLPSSDRKNEQSEFYPYRYLAAEGFLPGYNFTRLPVRAFMESDDGSGEYISRARFIAMSEFGPQNVIYHDGAKYRIDRMILTEADLKLEKAKISPKTGYFLYDSQYNFEVDPITSEPLSLEPGEHVHTTMLQMAESRAYEMQRITCQEEERTKKGYEIETYFSVDGGMGNTTEGIVHVRDEKLLHIHYMPTCRIFKLNKKWRATQEDGFTINLQTGYWLNQKQKREKIDAGEGDKVKDVKLFTSDTANALYIQPIKALALDGGKNGVITLMYAMKRAIENYFQVESNEIGATILGEPEAPNILLYESSEGSLGVLSQIVDSPSVYQAIMKEAYKLCFYINDVEQLGDVLPATYDDLLSYYNQYHHQQINRNLIRDSLRLLMESNVEILTNKTFDSYEKHFQYLKAARDQNSSTEEAFLDFLYKHGLRLPDVAQPNVTQLFVRPDFLYYPNVFVFCDGTPHDRAEVSRDDSDKRAALKDSGYQVLVWHYKMSLDEFVANRPDIFKKVKDHGH